MATRLLPAIQQVFSNLGEIGIGYKLLTYQTLTTTPLATYSDEALTSANANPASGATTGNQISDGNGRFGDIWVDSASNYKIVLTDENDVILDTIDPVDGGVSTSSLTIFNPIPEAFWGTTAGTSSEYTLDSNVDITDIGYSNTQVFKVEFHTPCVAAPTLAIDGLPALNLKKYTALGTKVDLEVSDVVSQTYDIRNDGTDLVVLNPQKPYINLDKTIQTSSVITIANGTDTDHDMNFSAGSIMASDDSVRIVISALTKQIDATWAAGTAAGGLADALTVANNTTYHCFALSNSTGTVTDSGFDTSLTATNLLADTAVIAAGLTKFKRIASLRTDSSANIITGQYYFRPDGSYTFMYNTPISDINGTQASTAETRTLSTPSGIITKALMHLVVEDTTSSTVAVYLSSLSSVDLAASVTVAPLSNFYVFSGSTSARGGSAVSAYTNTSSQIRTRGNTDIEGFIIVTIGYEDLKI